LGQEHQRQVLEGYPLTLCPNQREGQTTMIPAQTPLPPHLYSLLEDLTLAKSHLEAANSFTPLLKSDVPELAEGIADALTSCEQALSVLSDFHAYSDGGKADE
jgi:hypothetical protein